MSPRWRAGGALLMAALGCLLAAVLLAGSAGADPHPDVQVSVAGGPFTDVSPQPLLDVSALAPGGSTSAVLGVRSGLRSTADLYLRLSDVHDDDNGCVRPEQAVDTTCGPNGGEIGSVLQFRIETADQPGGVYTTRWAGPADQLHHAMDTALEFAAQATKWVRMTASLSPDAGRSVESDTYRFTLDVVLRGAGGGGRIEIGGEHTHRHAASPGGGPLALTGVAVTVLAGVGVLLVILGLLVLASAWRRNRARSAQANEPGPPPEE